MGQPFFIIQIDKKTANITTKALTLFMIIKPILSISDKILI